MIFAQSIGEYGGMGSLMATFAASLESASQWVQVSVREDTGAWLAVGIAVVAVFWLFRGR